MTSAKSQTAAARSSIGVDPSGSSPVEARPTPIRPLRLAPRQLVPSRRHQHLRPGVQLHHLAPGQHEPRHPRHRRQHRPGRQLPRRRLGSPDRRSGWPSAERDGRLPMDDLPACAPASTSGGRTESKRRDHRKRQLCDPGHLHRSRRRLEPEPGDAVGAESAFVVTGRASEPLPLRPDSSPTAGLRGRAGMPAADSANSTRKSPVVMTYRPSSGAPSSGALQRRLSPVGSTPRRISARAANRGASLVGDSWAISRPSASSSQ